LAVGAADGDEAVVVELSTVGAGTTGGAGMAQAAITNKATKRVKRRTEVWMVFKVTPLSESDVNPE
jgi:hypothetical protein